MLFFLSKSISAKRRFGANEPFRFSDRRRNDSWDRHFEHVFQLTLLCCRTKTCLYTCLYTLLVNKEMCVYIYIYKYISIHVFDQDSFVGYESDRVSSLNDERWRGTNSNKGKASAFSFVCHNLSFRVAPFFFLLPNNR
jgi:hypothetical protein